MIKFLYEKNIYNYLATLNQLGIEKYNDLQEYQEEELSKLIIDSLENDSFDILDLEDDDLPFRADSKEKILHNVYKLLKNDIDNVLSDIIEDQCNDYRRYNGLTSYSNKQTGEIEWRL